MDRITLELIFKPAKRAETRQCPVCDEHIPLRLLSRHAELESERVEDVIKKVGSSDITYDELDDGCVPLSLSHTHISIFDHILDLDPVLMSVVRLSKLGNRLQREIYTIPWNSRVKQYKQSNDAGNNDIQN